MKDYSKHDGLKDFGYQKIKDGFDFVIMGHRHRTAFINKDTGYYINLGDWIYNFSYGLFFDNEFTLNRFYDYKTKTILPADRRKIN